MSKILEKCFTKTVQGTIVLRTTRNRPKIVTFVKYFSKIFGTVFLTQLDELCSPMRKKILVKISVMDTFHVLNSLVSQ